MTQPGALMAAEIIEQPDAWRRLLSEGREQFNTVAQRIAAFDPSMVLFVARGTSDHAALYGKYLTEIVAQRPAGLGPPSTMTAYGARPRLDRVLMVGVSQIRRLAGPRPVAGGRPGTGCPHPGDHQPARIPAGPGG